MVMSMNHLTNFMATRTSVRLQYFSSPYCIRQAITCSYLIFIFRPILHYITVDFIFIRFPKFVRISSDAIDASPE